MNDSFKASNAWYGLEVLDSQHRNILERHDSIKLQAEAGELEFRGTERHPVLSPVFLAVPLSA